MHAMHLIETNAGVLSRCTLEKQKTTPTSNKSTYVRRMRHGMVRNIECLISNQLIRMGVIVYYLQALSPSSWSFYHTSIYLLSFELF